MNAPTYTLEVINTGISYQPCVWAFYAEDCQYKVATIGCPRMDEKAAKDVINSDAAKAILATVEQNPTIFK